MITEHSHIKKLLSLLPLSYMVVSIRELANNTFSTLSNISSYTALAQTHSNLNMNNIDIGLPRGRFSLFFINNSREPSILSQASSLLYYEQMEIQNNDLSQSKQVETEYNSCSSTSNVEENNISNNPETGNSSKHRKQCEINEAPVLNNILTPHEASKGNNQHILDTQQEVYEVPLAYDINQPTKPNAQDNEAHPISIFGIMEFLEIDSKNMYTSLLYMANFIRTRKVVNGKANNIPELKGFGKVAQYFIFSIYNSGWDSLPSDKYNNSFKTKVSRKFTLKSPKINLGSTSDALKSKVAEIVKLPLSIPVYPPKKVLEKSMFFDKRKNTMTKAKTNI